MEFEKELNQKLARQGGKRVDVVFVPVVRDELLPALIEGRGDIAAANLSVTEKRLKEVDFSAPLRTGVSEVLVTGPSSSPVHSLGDMAGREVFIRGSSSFSESVRRVNDSLKHAGKKPIKVQLADERLEEEDILEMVNAGLVPATIADDHVADFWKEVYDSIVVHPTVTVATGGKIAWAIRKKSPELKAAVDAFARTHAKGTKFGNIVDQRYWKDAGYVTNSATKENLAQFRSMIELFRKYGEQYGFDHLLLAAQGYQESGLDQNCAEPGRCHRRHAGYAKDGVRSQCRCLWASRSSSRIFTRGASTCGSSSTATSRASRWTRSTAACLRSHPTMPAPRGWRSSGPRLRRWGSTLNVWFNNVEVVAARDIGRETVTYVRNIYKYYVAYALVARQEAARRRAVETEQKRR